MTTQIIGTCGLCGGPVMAEWLDPPVCGERGVGALCLECGQIPESFGPTIRMKGQADMHTSHVPLRNYDGSPMTSPSTTRCGTIQP